MCFVRCKIPPKIYCFHLFWIDVKAINLPHSFIHSSTFWGRSGTTWTWPLMTTYCRHPWIPSILQRYWLKTFIYKTFYFTTSIFGAFFFYGAALLLLTAFDTLHFTTLTVTSKRDALSVTDGADLLHYCPFFLKMLMRFVFFKRSIQR